jgi:hypothetical protein
MGEVLHLEVRAHRDDIRRFVEVRLQEEHRLMRLLDGEEKAKEALSNVGDKCGGM